MVAVFQPEQESPISTVDTSQPPSRTTANHLKDRSEQDISNSAFAEYPELSPSARLIYPENNKSRAILQNNKLLTMSDLKAENDDDEADTEDAHKIPNWSFTIASPLSFGSPLRDPNYLPNEAGVAALVSGRVPYQGSNNDHRRDEKQSKKRSQQNNGSIAAKSKSDSLLESTLELALAKGARCRPPDFFGGVEGDIKRPSKEKQGLIGGPQDMPVKSHVLFLMIVNNPANEDIPTAVGNYISMAPYSTPSTEGTVPWKELWAQQAARTSTSGPYLSYAYGSPTRKHRDNSLHYPPLMSARYYDHQREKEYCIPTL